VNVKSVEKKEKNTAEITVEISAAKFEEAIDSAYKKNKNMIAIPGFRKGKAPRKIIEKMYGESVFYEDAIEIACPEALAFALEQEKLEIVGQPSISDFDISDEKVVTVKFQVALFPEVTVKQYKGLKAPKPAVKVLKKEIDEEIENIRKRNARIQTVERAAKNGDTANIDFEGFVDGVAFDGGKGEKYDLVLGSGQFIPGFEDQVVGMKAGETKDIDVTFPEQYAAELAGKPAVFKVTVNEVKESILPDVDDEFAKDVSDCDTLEEYKAKVKETITERKKTEAEASFREAIMSKLVDNTEADIPDAMIDERVEQVMEDYNNNLQAQGANLDKYLEVMGMEKAAFAATLRPTAEKNIKFELAMRKVAEVEEIEVTDEDCEKQLQAIADQYGLKMEDIRKYMEPSMLKNQLMTEKVQAVIFDSAEVEKKAAKKKEAAAETEEASKE